jgi:dipeptidyl aminopeptidase/acylaminoacyl peptidase
MPAQFKSFSCSPNKEYILVKMVHQPYSYLVPYHRFPFKVEIWKSEGALWRELFDIPLAENIPLGFDAVRKGPREIQWRTDKPSSIYWITAMDGGDPNKTAVVRDHLILFEPPFDGNGTRSIAFEYRFHKVVWGTNNLAIAHERDWDTRMEKVSSFDPEKLNDKKNVLFSFDWQNEYADPGDFITITGEFGGKVLAISEKEGHLMLWGKGGTSEGYRPFIDRFELASNETERLWQSNNPYYEYPIQLIDNEKQILLTRRESKTDVPNFFVRNVNNGVVNQITNLKNPYSQMLKVKQELVRYQRADGLSLSGKL